MEHLPFHHTAKKYTTPIPSKLPPKKCGWNSKRARSSISLSGGVFFSRNVRWEARGTPTGAPGGGPATRPGQITNAPTKEREALAGPGRRRTEETGEAMVGETSST